MSSALSPMAAATAGADPGVGRDELMRRGLAAQRLLQGDSPEAVAKEFQTTVDELENWRRYYIGDRRIARHRLKRFVARWPRLENTAKAMWYRWQIRGNRFDSNEPEFRALPSLVRTGDWVVDVGANIGTFTRRLSHLVGPEGRVIAFEPIGVTFSLLVGNVMDRQNVTVCSLAVSNGWSEVRMDIPKLGSGLPSFANATIKANGIGLPVLAAPLDSFDWPHRISLIKLDTEGHEPEALIGMRRLLDRDRPTIIVEMNSPATKSILEELGYSPEPVPGGGHVYRHR